MSNQLINEDSLYLKQHSTNPVNWYPYNDETLALAKKDHKMLLISIGYSSCHWCHVMEKECFEDDEVAEVMNKYFINVKVDREERPDIDAVYMSAVQLMNNGQGGWPLNCIATEEGIPIFGGTYFPKDKWIAVLKQIGELGLKKDPKIASYASNIKESLAQVDVLNKIEDYSILFEPNKIQETIFNWLNSGFDAEFGGSDRVPKFPMPVNFLFLLQHLAFSPDSKATTNILKKTLDQIALGGIYDHIEGGITRYSTDRFWKIPHFEKMLYDNAQIISLYALAFQNLKDKEYLYLAKKTVNFLDHKMKSSNGLFYSSIDADSDGVEGKYYVFTELEKEALDQNLEDQFEKYYKWNDDSYWEEDNHVVVRKNKIVKEDDFKSFDSLNKQLRALKLSRTYPTIDTKVLSGWNALLVTGFFDLFIASQEEKYQNKGEQLLASIEQNLIINQFDLLRSSSKSSTGAYLEDYASLIQAYIKAYQSTGNESYLLKAKDFTFYVCDHFLSEDKGYFSINQNSQQLFHQTFEVVDNVIPASNSIMANNLFDLSRYFDIGYFKQLALQMLSGQLDSVKKYTGGYANWLRLWEKVHQPEIEIVINGYKPAEVFEKLGADYQRILLAFTNEKSILPLNQNRYKSDENLVYICRDKSCHLPQKELIFNL